MSTEGECDLLLRIVPPKGGQQTSLSVRGASTGADLKAVLEKALGFAAETQTLLCQNGSRNAAKLPVDDARGLRDQGVEESAMITVRVNEEIVTPEASALRQSIAKNGGQSYYYAHANEKALPLEHRYVYGGEPARLDAPGAEQARSILTVPQAISQYSWADEGEFVCIYISADGEQDAIRAAGDGKAEQVRVDWDTRSFELRIESWPRPFALVLRNLENEIVAAECKHRVSAGKRVTLKLKKRRQITWTRLARAS